MFCTKCGKQIAEGAKFCPGCGAPTGRMQQGRQGRGERPARQSVQTDIPRAASGGRNLKIMLAAFLGVLALAGIGTGIFFLVSGRSKGGEGAVAETAAAGTAEETQTEEGAQKVTSDTNEVVNNRILDNVPKAVSAYDFEDGADGAQAVVRNDVEQQPEAADVAVQYVDGIEGRAVYLDGTYGLKLNSVGRIGESYTVAFWIKADALYDWSPFIHISYDILDPDRRCRLWVGQKTDGNSVAPILSSEQARDESIYEIRPDGMDGTMQPGVWYYIVFTVDGTRSGSSNDSVLGTLYVGGEKVGEGDVARDVMNADDPEVDLGINCWDALFPAAYDGVKIWDRTLDEEQVKELYQAYGAGGETAEAVDSAAQEIDWKQIYLSYLQANNFIGMGGMRTYCLQDINGDSIPEMFVNDEPQSYLCYIAEDGTVHDEISTWAGRDLYYTEDKVFYHYAQMGGVYDYVYQFVPSTRTYELIFAGNNNDGEGPWQINGKECTSSEEYDTQLAAYFDLDNAVNIYSREMVDEARLLAILQSAAQDGDSSVSYAAYQDILHEIHDGLIGFYNGDDSDDFWDNHYGIGAKVASRTNTVEQAFADLGYILYDLDGNGIDELIVEKMNCSEGPQQQILELYTLRDDEAVLLICAWDRTQTWLAEDNTIYDEYWIDGLSGDIWAYRMTGDGLAQIESYSWYYDSWDYDSDENNYVQHSTGGIKTEDGSVEGAEEETLSMDIDTFFDEIYDSFFALPEKKLELTPLSSLQ